MSPASYLTAPPRVALLSIAPECSPKWLAPGLRAPRIASIDGVNAFWAALALLVVAFVAGAVFVIVRALATKRALKSLRSALGVELERIAKSGERTTSELDAATQAFERLQASLIRFRIAYTRIRLVKGVLAEAEAVLARARAFVPSK